MILLLHENLPFCATRFDFDKFKSACTDVKQNIQSRLNQWTEYESQHDKLVNWLNECEANLKTYNVKASLEEKVQQLDRFKVCKAAHFFSILLNSGESNPGLSFLCICIGPRNDRTHLTLLEAFQKCSYFFTRLRI